MGYHFSFGGTFLLCDFLFPHSIREMTLRSVVGMILFKVPRTATLESILQGYGALSGAMPRAAPLPYRENLPELPDIQH